MLQKFTAKIRRKKLIRQKIKTSYESLLKFSSNSPAFIKEYKIQSLTNKMTQSNSAISIDREAAQLNHDCLQHICKMCTLNTQIQLAKVSQDLLYIVSNIWLRKYHKRYFSYDIYEFEFKHQLSEHDLQDFLMICGNFVEKLTFNTIFYFPLIQRKFMNASTLGGGNLMQNGKKFINENFCINLQCFEKIRSIEIHGKFLADFTIREIARYCNELLRFKLIDSDSRWLQGTYLPLLHDLTELCVKDCANLRPKYMLQTCKNLKNLQCLNINGCDLLQEPHFIVEMCKHLAKLKVLHISALANAVALDAILQLCNLKNLHFYWLSSQQQPIFERLYFEKLLQHKSAQLVTLNFINNRMSVENESKEIWTPENYAWMREKATINGKIWELNVAENDADILKVFCQFTRLREICFEYCRLLNNDVLLDLCKTCKSLMVIKLLGCRMESDEQLLRAMQRLQWCGDVEEKQIICIEGLLPLTELQHMRQHTLNLPYRSERNCQPVVRSISCEFI